MKNQEQEKKYVYTSFLMIDEVIDGWIQNVSTKTNFYNWCERCVKRISANCECLSCTFHFYIFRTFDKKVVFVQPHNLVLNNLTLR